MIGPRFDEKEKYEKDEGIKLARLNKFIISRNSVGVFCV